MEILKVKDFFNGNGFASYSLRDEVKELNLSESDNIVNIAYTDYGGDFFDRVFIEYFIENHKNSIIWENTSYFGKNAVLFGDIAKEFIEEFQNYPLGFRDIEEYYYNMEFEARNEAYWNIIKEYNRQYDNFISPAIVQYVLEYMSDTMDFRILSSGYADYCESDVIEKIQSFIDNKLPMILSENREKNLMNHYYNDIEKNPISY